MTAVQTSAQEQQPAEEALRSTCRQTFASITNQGSLEDITPKSAVLGQVCNVQLDGNTNMFASWQARFANYKDN